MTKIPFPIAGIKGLLLSTTSVTIAPVEVMLEVPCRNMLLPAIIKISPAAVTRGVAIAVESVVLFPEVVKTWPPRVDLTT